MVLGYLNQMVLEARCIIAASIPPAGGRDGQSRLRHSACVGVGERVGEQAGLVSHRLRGPQQEALAL